MMCTSKTLEIKVIQGLLRT